MTPEIFPVAIIGGGSAGVMAVLRTVLNNDRCLFFPGSPRDKKRSRAMWVRTIENMPDYTSYARGIEDPNQKTLQWISHSTFASNLHWLKNTGVVNLKRDEQGLFHLQDSKGGEHRARYVILATGVMDVQPLIGGEIAPILPYANLQSVDYCLRCDGHHVQGQSTAVIGHGVSAAWVAIMLYERYRPPAMHVLLHGEPAEFDIEVNELMQMYGIKIHPASIQKILGEPAQGQLAGFTLSDGSTVAVSMAFVSLGMRVYHQLAQGLGAELDERGFVKTNTQGQTSVEGLYVAGDLQAGKKKQVYTAWDTAVDAADAINQRLRAARRSEALATFRENVKKI